METFLLEVLKEFDSRMARAQHYVNGSIDPGRKAMHAGPRIGLEDARAIIIEKAKKNGIEIPEYEREKPRGCKDSVCSERDCNCYMKI